jgi:hypothetical protein
VANSPRAQSGVESRLHLDRIFCFPGEKGGQIVARKTVLVCDNCGNEIDEGKGASMRINYSDARRGSKQADLCDNCAGGMPGHAAARRGRRPKSVAA